MILLEIIQMTAIVILAFIVKKKVKGFMILQGGSTMCRVIYYCIALLSYPLEVIERNQNRKNND